MTTVNIYLTFDGNCRSAFEFYKTVFGGDFSMISTFAEMPPQEGMPPMAEDQQDKIMHVTLPISTETNLMGSDTGGWGPPIVQGNNFSVSVGLQDQDKATRIFNALSEGGEVIMPMNKTFWNAYFGALKDKFGIKWMVNCTME